MAITTNSGVINFSASGDIRGAAIDVSALVLSNTTAAGVDVIVAEGTTAALIATVTVPADGSVVIPFARPKHFDQGLRFTGAGCAMAAFLA